MRFPRLEETLIIYRRRTIRLRGYDYSRAGAYFVTLCTHNKECLFGEIVIGELRLNEYGRMVEIEWLETANIRNNVELDIFIVMPNHLHGIILITNEGRGVLQYAPTNTPLRSPFQTVGAVVRGFKSAVTKRINGMRGAPGTQVWQRNYYEHIIRNENKLNRIRKYIINNPVQWQFDRENPERVINEEYKRQWKWLEGDY